MHDLVSRRIAIIPADKNEENWRNCQKGKCGRQEAWHKVHVLDQNSFRKHIR